LAVVAALGVVASVGAGCSSPSTPDAAASAYPERTATVGSIDVKARPVKLDADGAAITLIFDSHSVSFDVDPVTAVTLDVDGVRWPAAGWDGQPPSGHHREGTVRFTAGGPARGTATLTIGYGLPQPAQFSWTIGAT
jgi:hypothetical protein